MGGYELLHRTSMSQWSWKGVCVCGPVPGGPAEALPSWQCGLMQRLHTQVEGNQVTYLRSLSLQGCACPLKALCRKPVTVTNKGLIFQVSFELTISTSIEIWLF